LHEGLNKLYKGLLFQAGRNTEELVERGDCQNIETSDKRTCIPGGLYFGKIDGDKRAVEGVSNSGPLRLGGKDE